MEDECSGDTSRQVIEVRIPGLRGVTVSVLIEHEVLAFFEGLAGAVRKMPQGTPLDQFHEHIRQTARNAFRRGIEEGRDPGEAAEVAGVFVSTYVVPQAYVWRVLEGARQVPQTMQAAVNVLALHLSRRPVQRAAVQEGLQRGAFPAEATHDVRRVLASAEMLAKRN